MKAILCKNYGPAESLVLEDLPTPQPGPKQVLIRVTAAGVNFPDALIIQGLYQFKPPLPFSPGGELAGVVEAVGENVHHLKAGDPVVAFTGWGAFAEQVVADAFKVFPVPADLDPAVAASFVMTYATAYHALKDRAQLRPGERVLVLGAAGGVGLAAVELAKLMDAEVIACASTDEKLALCREVGADQLINYSSEDLKERIKQLTDGKGVDVIVDPVGGDYAEQTLRSIAWEGRYLVIGFANGEIPKIPLNLPLLKGCAILGVFWGEFAMRQKAINQTNILELFGWLREGKLKPHISARLPLARAAEAIQLLASRQATGKVVVTTDAYPG
ncbi:NADPH:quinone oxidoreductase family protein [Chitinivorax sp. PXF-14]|uniref:NADPH:quinone oxidoreductase family protein n=1 Tax=Chitinivorax sp. PXF-14 TaxID=3230488 RepID=UPI003465F59D